MKKCEEINAHQYDRTALLIGEEGVSLLAGKKVILFGVGGVGGYVAEALARAGIGRIDLVDHDTVSLTNLNRQIVALHSTIGCPKVEVMAERIRDIDPGIDVRPIRCFYLPENKDEFDLSEYDYVIDAVDNVTAKIQLIISSKEAGVKIISSMGTGNKLDASGFEITDISKTQVCPLARVMRRELKKRGVEHVKVLYSKVPPTGAGNNPPGSVSFVPSVAGLLIAGEVVRDLLGGSEKK